MVEKVDDGLIVRCNEVSSFNERATDGELLDVLEAVGDRPHIYAFKHRLKGATKIWKKVNRKRREGRQRLVRLLSEREALNANPATTGPGNTRLEEIELEIEEATKLRDYSPDNITDAWGCRFVTLFQTDIPTTVSALLAELHAFNESGHGFPVGLKEFVVYTNRPDKDPLSIVDATLEALERSSFSKEISEIKKPENRKSAYSSVHLVLFRRVEIEHPGKPPKMEVAQFEIQVRDIFEEGWGEVQHHLLYSDKEEFDDTECSNDTTDADASEEGDWRLHLNALKTFVDGCSQHASIVRRHFDESKRAPISTNVTQSVTDRSEDSKLIFEALKVLQAPEPAIEAIVNGYALLEAGELAPAPSEKILHFTKASDAFDEGLKPLSERCFATPLYADRTVGYFLSMEFANSNMSVAEETLRLDEPDPYMERACFEAAHRVYSDMATAFPRDPVAHFRLGKVTERLARDAGQLNDALAITEKGIELIAADAITGSDHWIAIRAHIDKGFVFWRLAQLEESEQDPAALDRIAEAADANLAALDVWQEQSETARLGDDNRLGAHKAASNMLFFAGKLVEAGRINERISPEALITHMNFIDSLAIETHADYFKTRDNFLHAYRALGDTERAHEMADANFQELRGLAERRNGHVLLDIASIKSKLRGSAARCFGTASRFLFPEGG